MYRVDNLKQKKTEEVKEMEVQKGRSKKKMTPACKGSQAKKKGNGKSTGRGGGELRGT